MLIFYRCFLMNYFLKNPPEKLHECFEKEGIKIYNCNPETHCDAFEYKSFDDAFEDCKGIVREPFDLKGWYEKK